MAPLVLTSARTIFSAWRRRCDKSTSRSTGTTDVLYVVEGRQKLAPTSADETVVKGSSSNNPWRRGRRRAGWTRPVGLSR